MKPFNRTFKGLFLCDQDVTDALFDLKFSSVYSKFPMNSVFNINPTKNFHFAWSLEPKMFLMIHFQSFLIPHKFHISRWLNTTQRSFLLHFEFIFRLFRVLQKFSRNLLLTTFKTTFLLPFCFIFRLLKFSRNSPKEPLNLKHQ